MLGLFSLLLPLRILQVNGNSMEPTLRHGQRYLLDRFYFRLSGLQDGDLVVVNQGAEQIVKRLKALPGETLQVTRDWDGTVALVENVTRNPERRRPIGWRRTEFVVPPGHIYVLGDNLWRSEDSRRLGPIPVSGIIGVVRTFALARSFPEPPRRPRPRWSRDMPPIPGWMNAPPPSQGSLPPRGIPPPGGYRPMPSDPRVIPPADGQRAQPIRPGTGTAVGPSIDL